MAVLSAEAAGGAYGPNLGGELVPAEAEASDEAGVDLDVSVELDETAAAFCLALWAAAQALSCFC